MALDELLRELQSSTVSICFQNRCSIGGEFRGKIRKESFQLRSCPFREDLSQRWPGAGTIILRSGS